MKPPKFIRRWVYKRLLKRIERAPEDVYLCCSIDYYFPYQAISQYPELWDHRPHIGDGLVAFFNNNERIEYLQQAIKLTQNENSSIPTKSMA